MCLISKYLLHLVYLFVPDWSGQHRKILVGKKECYFCFKNQSIVLCGLKMAIDSQQKN